jgi:hypothetical protein
VGTRADLGGDLIEMKLHGFAVAEGQQEVSRIFRTFAQATAAPGWLTWL